VPDTPPAPRRNGRTRSRNARARLLPVALLVSLLAACIEVTPAPGATGPETQSEPPAAGSVLAAASDQSPFIVHRTDTCGCCGAYEEILEAHGVRVEASVHPDVGPVRRAFGVPEDQASCHTGQIAGYAVEGHVPLEAIDQLLTEQPEVDGIALAGMPAGSPGMPGPQEAPLVVTLVDGGEVVGELGRY